MSTLGAFGFGPGSNFRFSSNRTANLDGRNNSFRYPSQWWDIAHMELPTTVKSLFRWCRYHATANSLVSAVVKKMATYPITEVVIDEENYDGFDKNKKRWEDLLFRVLKIQRFQYDVGLDYYAYGNAIVSILYPFHKYLCCRGCGWAERIKKLEAKKQWEFRDFNYLLNCPSCGQFGEAEVKDEWYPSYQDIKLIRWSPEDVEIDFNPITQTAEYAYAIPVKIRNAVIQKNLRYLQELPHSFIQAIKKRRPIVLRSENVYHFKAPTVSLAANDDGWGYPPILPALKDSFYLQIMKKAQEAIMVEHLVPMDIIFPTAQDATSNPYLTVNLSDWKRRIELEIQKWRWDPNYKPILPLPVGVQRIGGTGKALMLTQEIRAWSEHIIAGMLVPQEFVFGGLCVSTSSFVLSKQHGMTTIGALAPETESRTRASDLVIQTPDGLREVSYVHNVGKKLPITARTRLGLEITGAKNHPALVLKPDLALDYVPLEDIEAGDYLVSMPGTEVWAERPCTLPPAPDPEATSRGPTGRRGDLLYPTRMTPEFARLLGYLVSEGCIDDERVRFGNTDDEVNRDFERCWTETFGALPSVSGQALRSGKVYKKYDCWSRDLVTWLRACGFDGKSHEKQIPWAVLQSPKEVVREFLRGYYEGDGSVCVKPDGHGSVVAYTASRDLARQLQLVLLNAGVRASVYEPSKASPIYKIGVRTDLARFAEIAGFVSKRKQALLEGLAGGDEPVVQVPYVRERIAELRRAHPRPQWERGEDGASVRGSRPWPRFYKEQVSLDALRAADLSLVAEHDPVLYARLERLKRGDLHFEQVVEVIEGTEPIPMSDFTVPGTEAYLADGLACHNTWSGSSVSLRMLENQFLGYRDMHEQFLRHFLIPNVARFMGWREASAHMKAFRMADDIQAKQILLSLNQLRKISDKTLLAEFNKDSAAELKLIEQELRQNLEVTKLDTLYKATVQGEAQVVMGKYQLKAQQQMAAAQQKMMAAQGAQPGQPGMPPGAPGEEGGLPSQSGQPAGPQEVNVIDLAEVWAKRLAHMQPEEQAGILQQMSTDVPQMHDLVMQRLSVMRAAEQRPLPEQRPPRRGPESAVI